MSFAEDVKPLFRDEDRASMDFAFDLWAYDDVKANATMILERIEEMEDAPKVIATGGLARLMEHASKYTRHIDENLTLDGLRIIHERA